eukprot:915202-Karenia_brevis.AAC.1
MWSRLVVAGFHHGLSTVTKDSGITEVDCKKIYWMYGRPTLKRVATFTPQSAESGELNVHHSVDRSLSLLRQVRRIQHIT